MEVLFSPVINMKGKIITDVPILFAILDLFLSKN